MKASEAAIQLIRQFEGFRSKPYICPTGHPTIGYGHRAGVTISSPEITETQAVALLAEDLRIFEAAVNKRVSIHLQQYEFDALVCFVFNIGEPQFMTSTLLRFLNAGNRAGAAAEFDRWNKGRIGGQLVPVAGLTRRRASERRLFEGRSGK